MKSSSNRIVAFLFMATALPGCSQLSGRNHAREGNRLYLEGNYAGAAKEYATAEQLLPTLSVITLNRGLACRQMMMPGAKTAENEAAVSCALDCFTKFQKAKPEDPRGEQLYLQTLFDADRFDTLIAHYEAQHQKNPRNLEAINALLQIYSRGDRWNETLRWTQRRADVSQSDSEAQYAVGFLIWNRLYQKGGSGDRQTFNPKIDPKQAPPPFAEGDVVGEERIRLAEIGISYLEKAVALRSNYREAMSYLNLLYRQKSFALFDKPDEWQAALDKAVEWNNKVLSGTPANGGQH